MTDSQSRRQTGPVAVVYGVYAWLAFVLCVLVAIIGALVLPGLERRRLWVSGAARASLKLSGIASSVEGYANLPQDHCIVVANHASYVDGVILLIV
jgi:1-acyl-sn-glycerol-3-phosphate acyltransferase